MVTAGSVFLSSLLVFSSVVVLIYCIVSLNEPPFLTNSKMLPKLFGLLSLLVTQSKWETIVSVE
jgi:hypothetical protein